MDLNMNKELFLIVSVFSIILGCIYTHQFMFDSSVFTSANDDVPLSINEHKLREIDRKNEYIAKYDVNRIRICKQWERLQNLKEKCEKYNLTGRDMKVRFVLDSKNKVAYCYQQKSGCSTMKALLANISSHGKVPSNLGPAVHSGTFLKQYGLTASLFRTIEDARIQLRDYTKILVIRHPLKRTLSGFYDKMRTGKYKPIQKIVLEEFRTNNFSDPIDASHPVLSEFLQLLVSNHNLSRERHWKPYERSCGFCSIDYQYMLKLETLESDLSQFLSEVYNTNNYEKYSSTHLNAKQFDNKSQELNKFNPEVKLKEFSEIDDDLFKAYYEKYKISADIFGYTYDKSTFMGTCVNDRNCC